MMPAQKFSVYGAALLATPLAWAVGPAGANAQTITNWFYQSPTSLEVPYTNGSLNSRHPDGTFSNRPATLNISVVGSEPIQVTMDTGSTGIAISRDRLPSDALNNLTPIGPGAINYDSSGAWLQGHFYQLPVSILGGTNSATGAPSVGSTSVKVLVVDSPGTAYMGVGNNRNNVYSGSNCPSGLASQGCVRISASGMNPFIDVAINGTALPNQGYVVMNNQVVLGLTTQNNGYSFIKLLPDPANGPEMWGTIPLTITTGNTSTAGDLLPDTGIGYTFLKPYSASDEYTVGVYLPGLPPQLGAFYSFQNPAGNACDAGSSNAMQPCEIKPGSGSTGFLNSGRQFYSGFNYLFDPINGFAGFAISSSGLPTTATLSPLVALTGTVNLPNGLGMNMPLALFGPTTLTTTQGGRVAFKSPVLGAGNNLSLSGGGFYSFSAPVDLGSGAFSLQQGAAAIGAGLNAESVMVSTQGALTNNSGSTIAASEGIENLGRLINNGILSGNLSNMGSLSGNGTLTGNLLNTGRIAPGNSIGSLTIRGNYAHQGGTLTAEIQGPQNDRIQVTGNVTRFTGRADLLPFGGGSPFPGFTYTIVNAPASSSFATNTSLNLDQSRVSSALLRFGTTLIQNPQNNPQAFAVQWYPNSSAGATTAALQALGNDNSNSLGLANSLDRAFKALVGAATNDANNSGSAIGSTGFTTGQASAAGLSAGFVEALNKLVLLPSGNQLVAAVNSLSAQPYAAFQTIALETLKQQRQAVLSQAGQCLSNGWIVNGKNAKRPLCAFALVQNSTSAIRGNSELAAYNGGVFSSGFGLEYYPSQQWSVGVNYGYGTSFATNFSTASASVSAAVNSVNLFSQFRPSDQWRLRALLGYSNFNGSASRSIGFVGPDSSLSANPNGNGFTAALETDYTIPLTRASSPTQAVIKPLLGLAWGSYQQSGFSESGNALALSVASHTANSFITTAGVEFSTSPIPLSRTGSVTIRPSLLLAYQVDALANNSANKSVEASFSQAPGVCESCSSEAQNLGTSAFNLTGSVDLQLSQSTALYVNASYNIYSHASQFGYGGGVRVRF